MSCRRRSRSASSSGSSSSGSRSPKKAMKRISNTPPRKPVHHLDTSISPAGKDRRSPSPRARRGRGSPSPARSSGMIFIILSLLSCNLYIFLLYYQPHDTFSSFCVFRNKISLFKSLFLVPCFLGLKRKPGGRIDSPSDNAKPRPSEGSESGKC